MRLKPQAITAFIQNPDPAFRSVLLFGPNSGLAQARARQLCARITDDPADPFNVAKLTVEQRSQNPSRLEDEMAALSMIGGRRVVWLPDAGNADTGAIGRVLESDFPAEAFLIVEAKDLSPRDSLRTLFEKSDLGAAIPCYDDDARTTEQVISKTCREAGLAVNTDAMQQLVHRISPDRRLALKELEKLVAYKLAGPKTVSSDDIEAVIGDNSSAKIDALAMVVLSGEPDNIDQTLDRLFAETVSAIQILRALNRLVTRCHFVLSVVANGQSREQAIKQLRPPVFWRDQSVMTRIISLWDLERLEYAMRQLAAAELDVKSTGYPDIAICRRTLLSLCAGARKR